MRASVTLALLLVACGDSESKTPATTAPVDVPDVAPDAEVDETIVEPPHPATLAERGFQDVKVIAHLHSAYSHDACDGAGLDADGNPNAACVARMKAALCQEHIAVAFMTDHPGHMREYPFEPLLYAGAGDEVVRDGDGNAQSVRFACPTGQGGPDGKTTLFVGFEGNHTLGIGQLRHLDPLSDYSISFEDATSSADLDTVTAALRSAGGMVAIAHSEETDLSAETIRAHDVPAMELYNFHANFKVVLGESLGEKFFELDPFLSKTAPPDPDLTALVLLDSYPEPALEKWRAVSAARRITAFAGSDVHENASLPALCADESVCDGFNDTPNLKAALVTGGPVMMSDGDRLDSYARVFRWVNNRVSIPSDASDIGAAVKASFEAGKNVVVFEVFGEAPGVALVAEAGDAVVDMGGTTAPGATLWARTPDAPAPDRVASWTDGSAAIVEGIVWRTDASGDHEVGRWTGASQWRSFAMSDGGSYHLEVRVTPLHLGQALGPAESMAHEAYRWVETNAIRVE